MDKETLVQLQDLNQISLTDEETAQMINYVAFLEEQNKVFAETETDEIERMVYVMPLENVLREDIEKKLYSREQLQEHAPEVQDGYWQVPHLLD